MGEVVKRVICEEGYVMHESLTLSDLTRISDCCQLMWVKITS